MSDLSDSLLFCTVPASYYSLLSGTRLEILLPLVMI